MTNPAPVAQVRLAVALAHSVPGTRLHVTLRDGTGVLVAAGCLGALTPCQFRTAVLDPGRGGVLLDAIERVAIIGGLVDLGGGLYGRGERHRTERWFATTLGPGAVGEALTDGPGDVPDDAFETVLRPDPELGAGVVCLRELHPAWRHRIDEVAHWALSRCLVGELVAEVAVARERS